MKIIYLFLLIGYMVPQGCYAKTTMPSIDRIRKKVDNALQDPKVLTLTSDQHAFLHNCTYDQERDIAEVECLFGQLFWAYQHELVAQLCNTAINSIEKKSALLDTIMHRHPGARPLVDYVQTLAFEEQLLSKSFTLLLKLTDQAKKGSPDKIKDFFEKHMQALTTLTSLMTSSNMIFMSM